MEFLITSNAMAAPKRIEEAREVSQGDQQMSKNPIPTRILDSGYLKGGQ